MGDFSSATGAVTFIMMLLSRTIFKKYGWGVAALITPTVLLITGNFRQSPYSMYPLSQSFTLSVTILRLLQSMCSTAMLVYDHGTLLVSCCIRGCC